MAENRNPILVNVKLEKNKNALHATPPSRIKKVVTTPARHILYLAVEVKNNKASWVERKVNKLQQFSGIMPNCRLLV